MPTLRRQTCVYGFLASFVVWLVGNDPLSADSVIIDNATLGFYSNGIGNTLNGTDPFFTDDPTLSVSRAPDISAAATVLGGWLGIPPDLATSGATWSTALTSIPTSWSSGTETAVVYSIGAADIQLHNVSVSIGVDNGIVVWLDGTFVHGDTAPGLYDSFGEYIYNLGNLSTGGHYLQFLRVGQSFPENWNIQVTASVLSVSEPSALILFSTGTGTLGIGIYRVRRRNRAA